MARPKKLTTELTDHAELLVGAHSLGMNVNQQERVLTIRWRVEVLEALERIERSLRAIEKHGTG